MFERLWGYEHPLSTQFRRLEEELDSLYGAGASLTGTRNIRSLPAGTFPAVNVASTPEAVMVYLFAPGMDAKSFDISMQQNLLSINGSREIPVDEQATYYRQERFSDIFESADGIKLVADMPGVSKENLRLQAEGNTLTIEGELEFQMADKMEALYADVRSRLYRCSFVLSSELDTSHIEAILKDGVLAVRIPKRAELQPRRIEVQNG